MLLLIIYFVSTGQLEWINNLQWSGQTQFLSQPRQLIVVNGLLEGYARASDRLQFFWMNVAGQSVRTILLSSVADWTDNQSTA